ncbi:MAG TPA: transcription termination factor NusA [Dehalococcoidia bacterium]|nr:transcription termination factor NusA [Dehalococcoidia bacterium]
MKNDFLLAIAQLAGEKNLPKEVVFDAVEAALASAYKKDQASAGNIVVKIDPNTGTAHFFSRRTVVDEVTDPKIELTLKEARALSPGSVLGEHVDQEVAAKPAGRIAAQAAKQVVLDRLRAAEREVVFEEYAGREGDIISGAVQRIEGSGGHRSVYIDLGKTEALLPPPEQVRTEHYQPGQRLKVYVAEVRKDTKGPQVIVSRAHKNLIKRLFELEVPEIFRGSVEIKSIAREAGFRSKVAVWARQEGVDPVGACVGLRGIRIQNVVNELGGERIDVVQWDPEPERFVANALSPAQVVSVSVSEEDNTASVVVPDRQLSLAIGKEGQNARLAAKLTGWRIDIRSQTAVEQERLAELPPEAAIIAEPEPAGEEREIDRPAAALAPGEPVLAPQPFETPEPARPFAEPEPEPLRVAAVATPTGRPAALGGIRFAEDLNIRQPMAEPVRPEGGRSGKKQKHRKAGEQRDEIELLEAATKSKKGKRGHVEEVEEEEYDEYQYLTKRR